MTQQKPITRRQQKIIDAATTIKSTPATLKDTMFLARQLVQATLPHTDPGNVPVWSRRCGRVVLQIQQGYLGGKEPLGYPYGSIPRLLLYWMTTEARRTKNRRLELGESLSSFIRDVGLNSANGTAERSDAARIKKQMISLFSAHISITESITTATTHGQHSALVPLARQSKLWWNTESDSEYTDPQSRSYVLLDQDFYDSLTARPVPVDLRALRVIQKSPLALDLYSFLAFESFLAKKSGRPRTSAWRDLQMALGANYSEPREFNRACKEALQIIGFVYPGLVTGDMTEGITVVPESLPAIAAST